uniref:Uncharacterized protein n=1 Tax=Chelativorans sp. (strain BNC1) TaxID=266779 RepID=Q11E11_CHESB
MRLITTLPLDPVRRAWGRARAASRPRIRGRRDRLAERVAELEFRSTPLRKGRHVAAKALAKTWEFRSTPPHKGRLPCDNTLSEMRKPVFLREPGDVGRS